MFHAVGDLMPLGIVEPVESADKIARYPTYALKLDRREPHSAVNVLTVNGKFKFFDVTAGIFLFDLFEVRFPFLA
jgi:hypothetical protein